MSRMLRRIGVWIISLSCQDFIAANLEPDGCHVALSLTDRLSELNLGIGILYGIIKNQDHPATTIEIFRYILDQIEANYKQDPEHFQNLGKEE